jgi:hypothetical protein
VKSRRWEGKSVAIAIKSMVKYASMESGEIAFAEPNHGVLPWEGNKDENLGSVYKRTLVGELKSQKLNQQSIVKSAKQR